MAETQHSDLNALREAKEAFCKYVENEQDPIKRTKLAEFIPYIDKTFDMRDLTWFVTKAMQTADATQVFREFQEREQAVKHAYKVAWRVRLMILWFIFLCIGGAVLWKGMGEVFVYKTPEGAEAISETFHGKQIVMGEREVTLVFSHTKMGLVNQPFFRAVGVTVALISLLILTIVKTDIRDYFI